MDLKFGASLGVGAWGFGHGGGQTGSVAPGQTDLRHEARGTGREAATIPDFGFGTWDFGPAGASRTWSNQFGWFCATR